ncbi:histidine kinase dimerization/phospho-acceptor domain-containing protein, partial [Nocardioides ferulae]|uniref:histidine kinase dimerization/phospho-acceptor domain-containing protein n=1 Tax=Nocardioides ferulae TaxID=2340821 RepID=UPI0023E7611A
MRSIALSIAAAICLLTLAAVRLDLPFETVDTAYFLVRAGAAAFACAAALRWPPGRRLLPALIAAGLAFQTVGDAVFAIYLAAGRSGEASWADPVYLASFTCFGVALTLPIRRAPRGQRQEALLDILTVTTLAVTLLWAPVLREILGDPSRPAAARALLAVYPVADVLVFAVLLRVLATHRWRFDLGWTLAAGVACWFAASLHRALGTDPHDPQAMLGWLVGSVLMAASTRPPGPAVIERCTTAPREDRSPRWVGIGQLTIAIGPLMVLPVLDLLNSSEDGHQQAPNYGMVVLLALAFVRTARLLRSEALARAEVSRSRRYFQKLADNSSDAVFLLDATGEVLDAGHGDTSEASDGLPAHAELRSWAEHLGDADTARLTQLYLDLLEQPGQTIVEEAPVTLPEGREVWLSARFTNLVEDPDVGGVVVSLSDVTAQKEAEQELERARDAALEGSRAKSAFLATMSHEIRTPLNGVIGLTGLLLTTDLDERQHTYAHGVQTAGGALLGIINDILDFSKVEAG